MTLSIGVGHEYSAIDQGGAPDQSAATEMKSYASRFRARCSRSIAHGRASAVFTYRVIRASTTPLEMSNECKRPQCSTVYRVDPERCHRWSTRTLLSLGGASRWEMTVEPQQAAPAARVPTRICRPRPCARVSLQHLSRPVLFRRFVRRREHHGRRWQLRRLQRLPNRSRCRVYVNTAPLRSSHPRRPKHLVHLSRLRCLA